MTVVIDWIARSIAWTAVTIFGGMIALGLGHELWQAMSADWTKTFQLIGIVTGFGIIMWAIQRTFDIW